jgi:RNA polymerase sigma-70 factor (ECF subfamily)
MKPLSGIRLDVLAAAREGRLPMNEPAFVALYSRLSGPLKGYLRRLTGNAAVAEDLLQDAFVRFLAAGRVPDDDEHRKNYLYRIATNLARDHFRREQRPTEASSDRTEAPPDGKGDVWAVLGRLSPRDRELLVLAYVEGMTHKEMAAVTGLMRASLKPLLFRARRRFAAALRKAGLVAPERLTSREVSS